MPSCQICERAASLVSFDIPFSPAPSVLQICEICEAQLGSGHLESAHFSAVTNTMWSENIGTQVMVYRILTRLSSESWAQEALDMLYLDAETKAWAEAGLMESGADMIVPTRDSHGAILSAGDTVTLIKDLPVKGAGFTAKRGTTVRGISLTDNPEHIEGRVNGQRIVLVAAFLKKA